MKPPSNGKGLWMVLATAFALRLVLILILPPSTDVFYVNREAVSALLAGENPYTHVFTSVPSYLMTPNSQDVYAYLPSTLLFYLPFYFIDIRVGNAVADLLVALSIYLIRRELFGDRGILAPAIYLFFPPFILFTSYYSNNVAIPASFALLSIYMLLKGREGLAGLFLGISLSSLQLSFLLLPLLFYYCLKKGTLKPIYISLLTFSAIVIPFFAQNPDEFVRDVLLFQLQRPALPFLSREALNLSLSGLLAPLGVGIPLSIRAVLAAIPLLFLFPLSTRPKGLVLSLAIFSSLSTFLLPNEVFGHYYLIPFSLYLAGLEKLK